MSRLKVNITMSLDGFTAGPDQSDREPLGVGGERLHEWLIPLKAFRETHREEGGEVNASTPFAEDILVGAGANVKVGGTGLPRRRSGSTNSTRAINGNSETKRRREPLKSGHAASGRS